MGLNGTIVGVLKNFHFKGADSAIEPMAFALAPYNYLRVVLIRLTPGKVPASLKAVEKAWNNIVPEYPLDYTFIDQDYDNYSESQIRLDRAAQVLYNSCSYNSLSWPLWIVFIFC